MTLHKKRARPTPRLIEQAADAIRKGSTAELAARSIGVSRSTWFRWLKRGEEGNELAFRRFHRAVKRAEATCAVEALQVIHEAAEDGNWKAAAWLLERRYGYTTSMYEREEVREAREAREVLAASPEEDSGYWETPAGYAALAESVLNVGPRRFLELMKSNDRVAEMCNLVVTRHANLEPESASELAS